MTSLHAVQTEVASSGLESTLMLAAHNGHIQRCGTALKRIYSPNDVGRRGGMPKVTNVQKDVALQRCFDHAVGMGMIQGDAVTRKEAGWTEGHANLSVIKHCHLFIDTPCQNYT